VPTSEPALKTACAFRPAYSVMRSSYSSTSFFTTGPPTRFLKGRVSTFAS
jgi:hypothetical protein